MVRLNNEYNMNNRNLSIRNMYEAGEVQNLPIHENEQENNSVSINNNKAEYYYEKTKTLKEQAEEYAALAQENAEAAISALETHINNKTNPHEVTKSQVGLGNADNTSDINKPVSTAVQNNYVQNTQLATVNQAGIVRPDGTTITADENGIISSQYGAALNDKADVDLSNINSNAKSLISSLGKPSDTHISLLNVAPPYTMPYDGWITATTQGVGANVFLYLQNTTSLVSASSMGNAGIYVQCCIPAKQGDSIQWTCTGGSATLQSIWFVRDTGTV